MKRGKWFVVALSLVAGLMAVSLIPNTSWNLSVFAQTYNGGGGSGDDGAPDINGLDVGPQVSAIAFGPATITDEMAYRNIVPDVADLLLGPAEVEFFSMPPTGEVYPAPSNVANPEPVKTRTVDNITINHYFISILEGTYLYQVNIVGPDGTLINDNLMYLVYPDGEVYWFYQFR